MLKKQSKCKRIWKSNKTLQKANRPTPPPFRFPPKHPSPQHETRKPYKALVHNLQNYSFVIAAFLKLTSKLMPWIDESMAHFRFCYWWHSLLMSGLIC